MVRGARGRQLARRGSPRTATSTSARSASRSRRCWTSSPTTLGGEVEGVPPAPRPALLARQVAVQDADVRRDPRPPRRRRRGCTLQVSIARPVRRDRLLPSSRRPARALPRRGRRRRRPGPRSRRSSRRVHAAGVETFGEELKTAPRGYPARPSACRPAAPQVAVRRRAPDSRAPDGIGRAAALSTCATTWGACEEINAWLAAHVGPSELPEDARGGGRRGRGAEVVGPKGALTLGPGGVGASARGGPPGIRARPPPTLPGTDAAPASEAPLMRRLALLAARCRRRPSCSAPQPARSPPGASRPSPSTPPGARRRDRPPAPSRSRSPTPRPRPCCSSAATPSVATVPGVGRRPRRARRPRTFPIATNAAAPPTIVQLTAAVGQHAALGEPVGQPGPAGRPVAVGRLGRSRRRSPAAAPRPARSRSPPRRPTASNVQPLHEQPGARDRCRRRRVVNKGQASGAFPVTTRAVSANTTVTITAKWFDITRTTTITLTPGAASPRRTSVAIQTATWKQGLLTIKATSTNPNAILSVFSKRRATSCSSCTTTAAASSPTSAGSSPTPSRSQVRSNLGGSASAVLKS